MPIGSGYFNSVKAIDLGQTNIFLNVSNFVFNDIKGFVKVKAQ